MLFVLWIPLLLQLIVPVSLLVWLAFGRPENLISWLLRLVLVTCYVVGRAAESHRAQAARRTVAAGGKVFHLQGCGDPGDGVGSPSTAR